MYKYKITVEFIFEDLLALCHNHKSVEPHASYATLRKIFFLVLDDRTAEAEFSFSGPFAKLDFLVKEYHVPKQVYYAMNQFRARIGTLHGQPSDRLAQYLLHDVRLLATFVSCVYKQSIPKELDELLPQTQQEFHFKEETEADEIRVSVTSWDDQFIIAERADENGKELKICYAYSTDAGDLTPIEKLLSKNTTLNLVRPRVRNDIYYPEFIIYEPDFLVDISTIAEGFEDYGLTPYSYLVKRLQKRKITQAILIGNLAGQFLDEEVYSKKTVSYKDSVTRFFQNFALNIATCEDFDRDKFHKEAQRQQINIREYTAKQLDGNRIFDPEHALLEPSFFCPTLGVQGRMDLLTDDQKVLVEQKSGKWGFPNGGHQEKHYVQMLFYLAWLRYKMHVANEDVNVWLLYSKYPSAGKTINQENGLMKEGPAPRLLFEAIQYRNTIAYLEKNLEQGTINSIEELSADTLNVNQIGGTLWRNYQKPQIDEILNTVKNASDLERAYFYRFFTFLEKEYHLSKTEFAMSWNLTMEEKRQEGMVYSNLQLIKTEEGETNEGIEIVDFQIDIKDRDDAPNFRNGDIVIFYPYNPKIDKYNSLNISNGIVFRATIKELTDETLSVKLRSPQRNKNVFRQGEDTRWVVEHDFLDSSFSSSFKDLFSFLTMTNQERKALILNQRQPEKDSSVRLNNDYGAFNDLVLKAKQAKDYFIVIGPPGTGKTSFALVNILRETLSDTNTSVLLVSYTNRAVEEICSKLIAEGIDFVRIGHEHSCSEGFDKSYLLKNRLKDTTNLDMMTEFLKSVRVYVGTTASIASMQNLFSLKTFDLAIVDEASQILEPQIMGLLTANYGKGIQKFVFIGDHKQLPAVVQQTEKESKVEDPLLWEIGLTNCRHSFFERMLRNQHGDDFVYMLNHQGRMHPEVSDFVNQAYYGGQLGIVPLKHQTQTHFYGDNKLTLNIDNENVIDQLLQNHRLMWLDVKAVVDSSSDMVNMAEAELIATLVKQTYALYQRYGKDFNALSSIGVIVPYRSQISMVHRAIERLGIEDLRNISVDTVERFQGSQRDVIIYGTTVKKEYQLGFLGANVLQDNKLQVDRKLNVAISRAKEQMIVVGNATLLERCQSYTPFINYLMERQKIFTV